MSLFGDVVDWVGDNIVDPVVDTVSEWGGVLIGAAKDFGGTIAGVASDVGHLVLNGLAAAGNLIGDILGIKFATGGTLNGDGDNEILVGLDFNSVIDFLKLAFTTLFSKDFWTSGTLPSGLTGFADKGNGITINGKGGNDTIFAFGGVTNLNGDSGNDKVLGLSLFKNYITGGTGNDFLVGAGLFNDIRGGSGTDTIIALGADNVLFGGSGNDVIQASGIGNTVHGDSGKDTIIALGGANFLYGGTGNDTILALLGIGNFVVGGDGSDTVVALGGGNEIYGDNENFTGTGNDVLIAGGLTVNFVYGGAGNDVVVTGGIANFLYGGSGNDKIVGIGGGNFIYGDANGGNIFGSGEDTNPSGFGNDLIIGFGGLNAIWAEGGNDVVIGLGLGNFIDTGSGDDVAVAVGGGNILLGEGGEDVLVAGGTVANGVFGGDDNDVLVSLAQGDLQFGGGGDDVLVSLSTAATFASGGSGKDVIVSVGGSLKILFGDDFPIVFPNALTVEAFEAFGGSIADFAVDIFDDLDLTDFEFEDLSLPTLPTFEDFDLGSLDILGNLLDTDFWIKLAVPDFLTEDEDDAEESTLEFGSLNFLTAELDPDLPGGIAKPTFDSGLLPSVPSIADLGVTLDNVDGFDLASGDGFLSAFSTDAFDSVTAIGPSDLGTSSFVNNSLVTDQLLPAIELPSIDSLLSVDTGFFGQFSEYLSASSDLGIPSLGLESLLPDLGFGLPDLSGGGDPDVLDLQNLSLPSSRTLDVVKESFATTGDTAEGTIYTSGTGRGDVTLPDVSLPAVALPTFDLFDLDDPDSDIMVSVAAVNAMFGGFGSDLMIAAGLANVEFGQDGSDLMIALGKGNLVSGGDQDDIMVAAGIVNLMSGGRGNDIMGGGGKFNIMAGASGDDVMIGGGLLNVMLGGSGSDLIAGGGKFNGFLAGADNDVMVGGGTFNVMLAGAGDDIVAGGGKLNVMLAGEGDDVVVGFGKFNGLFGGEGDDIMLGGGKFNVMDGDIGDDIVIGGGKFNTLLSRGGNDILLGGGTFNTLFAGEGTDIVGGGGKYNTIFAGDDNDIVIGGGKFNTILAGGGDDLVGGGGTFNTMLGGDGADLIIGGGKLNTMLGQEGADIIIGGGAGTLQSGGLGNDVIFGLGVPEPKDEDKNDGNDGPDYDFGTDAGSSLLGDFGNDLILSLSAGRESGEGESEVSGGTGDDFIISGSRGRSNVDGGDGFDFILSVGQTSVVDGGNGNDIIASLNTEAEPNIGEFGIFDNGQFQGGLGNDLILAVGVNVEVFGDEDSFLDDESSSFEGDADLIIAGGVANRVFAGAGDDVVYTIGGLNLVEGGTGDDRLIAIGKQNLVFGNDGDDLIVNLGSGAFSFGGDGSDSLYGNGFAFLDWLGSTASDELSDLFVDGVELIGANIADFFDITFQFLSDPLEFDGSAIQMTNYFAGIGDDTAMPVPEEVPTAEEIKEAEQEVLENFIFNVLDEVSEQFGVNGLGTFLALVDEASYSELLPNFSAVTGDLFDTGGGGFIDSDFSLDFSGTVGSIDLLTLGGSSDLDGPRGGDGDDFLFSGLGIERLRGGAGNDTYTHMVGDGIDVVDEEGRGGSDTLVLGASGILPSLGLANLQFSKVATGIDGVANDLLVQVFDGLVWTGSVLITDQGEADSRIETLLLADGLGAVVETVDLQAQFEAAAVATEATVTADEFKNVVETSASLIDAGLELIGTIGNFFDLSFVDLLDSARSSTGESIDDLQAQLDQYFQSVEVASAPLLGLGGADDIDDMFDGNAYAGAPGLLKGFSEVIEAVGQATIRTTRFLDENGRPRIEISVSPISLDLDDPVEVVLIDGVLTVTLPPGLGLDLAGLEDSADPADLAAEIAALVAEVQGVPASAGVSALALAAATGPDSALDLAIARFAGGADVTLRSVAITALPGAEFSTPVVLTGGPGTEAIILDGRALPAGTAVQLDGIEFAYVIGEIEVLGSDGDDILAGNDDVQIFRGGNGNDVIYAGGGADLLIGGSGNDLLGGNRGGDTYLFETGSGSDQIDEQGDESDSPADRIIFADRDVGDLDFQRIDANGGAQDDLLITAGADAVTVLDMFDPGKPWQAVEELQVGDGEIFTLRAGLDGTDGRDILVGGDADEEIAGNDGDDLVFGGGGADTLLGGDGDDLLRGQDGDDRLLGEAGADTLLGGGGSDVLLGGEGDDALSGGADGDRLQGGAGGDTLHGDDGDDILFGDLPASPHVSEILVRDPIHYLRFGDGNAAAGDVGREDGTTFNGVALGAEGINAESKSARFDGLDDSIEIAPAGESLPREGAIQIWFNADDVNARQSLLSKDFRGLDDDDRVTVRLRNGEVKIRLDERSISGAPSGGISSGMWHHLVLVWSLVGLELYLDGELIGTTRARVKEDDGPWILGAEPGGDDDDDGDGGSLKKFFAGEMDEIAVFDQSLTAAEIEALFTSGRQIVEGDDNLFGGDGEDQIFGGAGQDDLSGDAGADLLDGGIGDDQLSGGGDDDVLIGGDGADVLFGDAGDDDLFGGAGADLLVGGDGADDLQGGAGDDRLVGGAGADALAGDAGDDVVDGGAGDDRVFGDSAVTHSLEVLGRDPVAYLRFDEADGTTAEDRSGNDHDGAYRKGVTLGNAGISDESKAAGLDGRNDYVEIADSDDFQLAQGTLQLWFNADDTDDEQGLVSKDSRGHDDGGHLTIWIDDDQLEVRLQDDHSSHRVTGGELSEDVWHQLVFSWGAVAGMSLYLDAELVDSDDYTGGLLGNFEPFVIGASQSSSGNGVADRITDEFRGLIDEFVLFDWVLDDDEIEDLFESGPISVRGDDTGIYRALENENSHDLYDGGAGFDTLRLIVTQDQIDAMEAAGELAAFQAVLDDTDPEQSANAEFQFQAAFDLTARNWEELELVNIDTNIAPVAGPDMVSTDEDSPVGPFDVLGNDADPDESDALSVLAASAGAGVAELNADGTISYDPNGAFEQLAAGQEGTDTILYTLGDGIGGIATGTVTVTIAGRNDAPSAADDVATVDENATAAILVLDNDNDPDDGDGLTIVDIDLTGAVGNVTQGPAGTLNYDPFGGFDLAAGESAQDSFRYTVEDGSGERSTATVTVTVNGIDEALVVNTPPVAVDDTESTDEDTPLVIDVFDLTANDTDADGDSVSIGVVDDAASIGSATLNLDGTITYDPNGQFESLTAGQSTTDSFTYTVSDGKGGTDTATVTVTIDGLNEAPGLADTGTYQATENVFDPVAIDGLSVSDPDSVQVTVSLSVNSGSLSFAGPPPAGVLIDQSDPDVITVSGAKADVNLALAALAFTTETNFEGVATLSVTADDDDPSTPSTERAVPILVDPGNTLPTVETDRIVNLPYDSDAVELGIIPPIDPDSGLGGELTVTIDSLPSAGTLTIVAGDGTETVIDTNGTVISVQQLRQLVFAPDDTGAVGSRALSTTLGYTVTDGLGGSSQGLVTIEVTDDQLEVVIDDTVTPPLTAIETVPLTIVGGDGSDVLLGGDGSDTIEGRGGLIDLMGGGTGADTFIFGEDSSLFGVVVDFDPASDSLQLNDGIVLTGAVRADVIGDGSADDIQLSFQNGNTIVLVEAPIGTYTLSAGLTLDAAAADAFTLGARLGGAGASESDLYQLTGDVELRDGIVEVSLADTYVPLAGDSVAFLETTGTVSAQPSTLSLAVSGVDETFERGDFDLAYGTDTVAFVANQDIVAGDSVFFFGSDRDDAFVGGAGADTLMGGAGNDSLDGGAGSDTLIGDSGDDVFIFRDGGGDDIITGFADGDRIDLTDFIGITDIAGLAITPDGTNTLIQIDIDDSVTLVGVDSASVQSDDFLFAS